ncbi:MAG: xanthine dehydrogenase family protein subunit M [Phycisphaerae bacterium]|nr:xanthine dehydrogenase family protein subunit M [Phycisphaerae bacterium]
MHLPDVTIHHPASLAEASATLRRLGPRARALAGGTDLVVDLKTRRVDADHLVSLARVPHLRGVERAPLGAPANGDLAGALRIGALTTIAQLDRSPELRGSLSALREATRDMAATQVRHTATVGGNIAGAVPCADLPPVLLVLGAWVEIASDSGTRTLPLVSFFTGPRQTLLAPGELLTAILVPPPPTRTGAAYARFSLREGNAIAVASVAAAVTVDDAGRIARASLALGAVAPVPRLVELPPGPERSDDDAIADAARRAVAASDPINDIRGSAEYRRELVRVLAGRAMRSALERAREARP